jgi:hypothetical protein
MELRQIGVFQPEKVEFGCAGKNGTRSFIVPFEKQPLPQRGRREERYQRTGFEGRPHLLDNSAKCRSFSRAAPESMDSSANRTP